jgi:hypothetical protein
LYSDFSLYWLVDFQRGGRRVRKAFKNLELAKTWAEGKKQEVVNKGMEVLNLSDKVRAEAVEAMRRLEGTGVGILEAIDDYLRRQGDKRGLHRRGRCPAAVLSTRLPTEEPAQQRG